MAKAPITHSRHTAKDKRKRREEREKAKAKGERISLDESRRRAGVELDKIKAKKQVTVPKETPTTTKPTIQLNQPQEKKEGLQAPNEEGVIDLTQQGQREETLAEKLGPVGIVGAGVALGAGAYLAGTAIAGIIGTRATQAAIQSGFAQQAAATGTSFVKTIPRAATQTVSKVGSMVINSKTIGLAQNLMAKFFTKTVTSINLNSGVTTVTRVSSTGAYAATALAWASSIFLGRWGQAEAPESIMIPIREQIALAETPEDWEIVEEHLAIAEEISDITIWEEIILWSPFSAVEGISSKMKGVAEGLKILAETAKQVEDIQMKEEEQGESDFAKDRRESDEAARERDVAAQEEDTAKYDKIEEDNNAKKLAEAEMEQEFSRLIGLKKYDEANALKVEFFENI